MNRVELAFALGVAYYKIDETLWCVEPEKILEVVNQKGSVRWAKTMSPSYDRSINGLLMTIERLERQINQNTDKGD